MEPPNTVNPGPALSTPDDELAALTTPEALMGKAEAVRASWDRHSPAPGALDSAEPEEEA